MDDGCGSCGSLSAVGSAALCFFPAPRRLGSDSPLFGWVEDEEEAGTAGALGE